MGFVWQDHATAQRDGVFTTPVIVQVPMDESGDKLWWRVVEPIIYHSERYSQDYKIPVNFETDFASVPRWPVVYLKYGGRASAAAIVHDYLYNYGMALGLIQDREEADFVFLDAMLDTKVDPDIAQEMFDGVRQFGESHFHKE